MFSRQGGSFQPSDKKEVLPHFLFFMAVSEAGSVDYDIGVVLSA